MVELSGAVGGAVIHVICDTTALAGEHCLQDERMCPLLPDSTGIQAPALGNVRCQRILLFPHQPSYQCLHLNHQINTFFCLYYAIASLEASMAVFSTFLKRILSFISAMEVQI